MRKLATIRKINDIAAIEGADRIVAYQVDGWWVVDQKDKYNIGDEVVYFEIDSWVPHKLAPFLSKGAMPKTFNGVEGNRLRTIRLKGQLSQGLIISIQQCLEFLGVNEFPAPSEPQPEGEYVDLTDVLGVLKWEAPVHASLGGLVRGNFPSWGRKTDQERIQNLRKTLLEKWYNDEDLFEVTIKLDGSSMSVGYSPEGEFVVCSRNLMLDLEQEGNVFVDTVKRMNLKEVLLPVFKDIYPEGFLVQGELIGEGIQGNKEGIKGHEFYVFDVYTPKHGYVAPGACRTICYIYKLNHAPILNTHVSLKELGIHTISDALEFAEGKSLICGNREGVVFKMETPSSKDQIHSFKAISNKWLLEYKE